MNTKANYCKFQSYRIAKITTSTKPDFHHAYVQLLQIQCKLLLKKCYFCTYVKKNKNKQKKTHKCNNTKSNASKTLFSCQLPE